MIRMITLILWAPNQSSFSEKIPVADIPVPSPSEASTKVYQAKADGRAALQRLTATVGPGGLLVLSPDPLVPFAQSLPGEGCHFFSPRVGHLMR